MSRDECDDVPAPKSALSTSATRNPRNAASRAIPAPVMPPPMISTSTGASNIAARDWARVCSNSPPLGAGGRFRTSPPDPPSACGEGGRNSKIVPPPPDVGGGGGGEAREEQSNAESQRSSRSCHRRRPDAICQSRHVAEGRAGR